MSFLRWAGSKKQLGDILANCWYAAQCADGSGKYIEAFCGSASLFFRIKPPKSLLIDVNKRLIDTFISVKDSPRRLSTLLETYPATSEFYYSLRGRDVEEMTELERAARFIFLNRYCFNGLYRTNLQGHFNVPFGGDRSGTLPDLNILLDASQTLKKTELVSGDFYTNIVNKIQPGDFVYLDPPYAKRNHRLALQYGPDVFGVEDLRRLFDLMTLIDQSDAYFLFSYAECEEVAEFVEQWGAYRVEVNRTIAATSTKRKKAKEVLISNL